MSRLSFVLGLALSAVACVNFDEAYATCHLPGGRCVADGGEEGGGSGGGNGGALGGGTGGCQTCLNSGGACVTAPFNRNNSTCGGGGIACVDCTLNSRVCDPTTLACASWQSVMTDPNHDQLWGAWAVNGGEAWFTGSRVGSLLHLSAARAPANGYLGGSSNYALHAAGVARSATLFVAGGNGGQAVVRTFNEPWDGGDAVGVRVQFSEARIFNTVFPAGSDVFIAGDSFSGGPIVFIRDGGGWTNATPAGMTGTVLDGFGVGPGDYYVVTAGPNTLGHKTPGGYTSTALAGVPSSLWGTPQGTLWLAGNNLFARVRDGGVTYLDAGAGAKWWSLWAADDSSVFLAGRDANCAGRLMRFDGTTFNPTCLSATDLLAVHGTAPTDVWATDADGGIWHYGP